MYPRQMEWWREGGREGGKILTLLTNENVQKHLTEIVFYLTFSTIYNKAKNERQHTQLKQLTANRASANALDLRLLPIHFLSHNSSSLAQGRANKVPRKQSQMQQQ